MIENTVVTDYIEEKYLGKSKCHRCFKQDGPLVTFSMPLRENITIHLCVPCLGKAIQDATGWKVINTFSQWRLQQITGRKTQEFKQQVRDAIAAGVEPPTAPEGIWQPPKHV